MLRNTGFSDLSVWAMTVIIRTAQFDFHFAKILKQRKTQKFIVAGFEYFGDVLNNVGKKLSAR